MSRQTLISILAIFLAHYGGTLDPEVERAFAKVQFQLNGLESKNDFLKSQSEYLKSQNDFLKSKIASLEAKNHHQSDSKFEGVGENCYDPNLEGRVDKLEQLSKVRTLRSCEEYASFGIKTSGMYPIDPDGISIGQPPFEVYCRFDEKTGQVFTEVIHNYSEDLTDVDYCSDPGCYVKNITYVSGEDGHPIKTSQLEVLTFTK